MGKSKVIARLRVLCGLETEEPAKEVTETALFLARAESEQQRAVAIINKLEQHINHGTRKPLSPYVDDAGLLELAREMQRHCNIMLKATSPFSLVVEIYQHVVGSFNRLEQAFNYDRSHPQLVALDTLELTYDNWLQDMKKAEALHTMCQDGRFSDQLEEMKKKQAEQHESCLNEKEEDEKEDDKAQYVELKREEVPPKDDSNLCSICFEHERNHVLLPCGHILLCESCAQSLSNKKGNTTCPLCRAKVAGIFKVYF